jgi:hypothetical protein
MKHVNPLMTLCFVMVFLLMAAASCKKGDTGPAGPAGPAGPTGAAGAAGATGATGTANVIYSDWTPLTFVADTQHNGAIVDTVGSHYSWNVPKLTTDILNKGEIKVYINFGTTTAPDIVPVPYFDGSVILNDEFIVSTILMGSNAYVQAPFRYILIPGGTAARSSINWNNYADVKKALNLKD